ncbi:alpha/beta hydrolase [Paenibacillus bovis]|uniref:Alpha/beta hydrolase n=1 Tax=Paenibacillus bovis TaxID=1616788 RepID=A0A172ZJW6_9BACL|nr:alpha/beta hydrolase [Paenibacillus bovis]ANF97833.1 hypothetical protein AR543_18650 [Paenibacillus bovis]
MKLEILTVPSFWEIDLQQKYYQLYEGNKKLVVLFPGMNYPCNKSVLHFAGTSAMQSGFDLMALEYGYQAARTELDMNDLQRLVDDSYESVKQVIGKYDQVVFISKSLGTVIAGEVHQRLGISVKHLFLTPLKDTIHYINKWSGVVVYGTEDQMFNADWVSQMDTEIKVFEILHAKHSLETDDVKESVEILNQLVHIYMTFLNE